MVELLFSFDWRVLQYSAIKGALISYNKLHKRDLFFVRKLIQPIYNQKGPYLPVFKGCRFLKYMFINYLAMPRNMQTYQMSIFKASSYFWIHCRTVQKYIFHKHFENRYLKSNRTNVIAGFKLICMIHTDHFNGNDWFYQDFALQNLGIYRFKASGIYSII